MVHRDRRRYLVVHISSPARAGKGLIIKMLRDRTSDLGFEDYDRMKPWVVYYNMNWVIIKCRHLGKAKLMEMLRELDGTALGEDVFRIEVLGISGTIKKAFSRYVPGEVRASRHYHEDMSPR